MILIFDGIGTVRDRLSLFLALEISSRYEFRSIAMPIQFDLIYLRTQFIEYDRIIITSFRCRQPCSIRDTLQR